VVASSNPVTVSIRSKLRVKWIPDKINYSIFFGNHQAEEPNLAVAFLDVLNKVPEQCLEAICKNVIFAGGFWRIKGIQKMFKANVLKNFD
jgi:hypothetical protein